MVQNTKSSNKRYKKPTPPPAPVKKKPPLQFMRGSAQAFWKANPTLAAGQPAVELDMHRVKVGDGKTPWRRLPYISRGPAGKQGKSAYEVWRDIGHKGTVDDFFDSLMGPEGKSAYEIWLSLGNTGSVSDFIVSLQGDKGDSAYDVWLKAGNEGTVEDFLASLKGEKGDPGKSAYEAYLEGGGTLSEPDFDEALVHPIQWGYY